MGLDSSYIFEVWGCYRIRDLEVAMHRNVILVRCKEFIRLM